jgi:glutamyl-tRNA synthetase
LIVGADKKRLSKRHGATSVTEYRRQGYLPQAMVNFLALLGWSPGDDRQLMSVQELIDSFALTGISGGNAVFDTEKLDWMNGQYIQQMSAEDLAAAVLSILREAGLQPLTGVPFAAVLELLRPRAKRITDFVDLARPFLVETVEYDPEAVEKHLRAPDLASHVASLAAALRAVNPFDEPHVEAAVRGTAAERGLKAGVLIHAARVAVTGRMSSPGLFEMLVLLGRDRTVQRLDGLVNFLASRA